MIEIWRISAKHVSEPDIFKNYQRQERWLDACKRPQESCVYAACKLFCTGKSQSKTQLLYKITTHRIVS